ncbi:predicted protein [Streptomyces albidoflavus]|nr:predicted protein [Streptomyces albidoflavus]
MASSSPAASRTTPAGLPPAGSRVKAAYRRTAGSAVGGAGVSARLMAVPTGLREELFPGPGGPPERPAPGSARPAQWQFLVPLSFFVHAQESRREPLGLIRRALSLSLFHTYCLRFQYTVPETFLPVPVRTLTVLPAPIL